MPTICGNAQSTFLENCRIEHANVGFEPLGEGMKTSLATVVFACLAFFAWLAPGSAFAVEPGTVVFCEGINDQFQPVNPGSQFPGPAVSWLATAANPFGKPAITISIYRNNGPSQTLLSRANMDVNPAWDTIGIRNMPIPEEGEYMVAVNSVDGQQLASGTVTITKAENDTPPPPKETVGTTLEAIYKKYAPKK